MIRSLASLDQWTLLLSCLGRFHMLVATTSNTAWTVTMAAREPRSSCLTSKTSIPVLKNMTRDAQLPYTVGSILSSARTSASKLPDVLTGIILYKRRTPNWLVSLGVRGRNTIEPLQDNQKYQYIPAISFSSFIIMKLQLEA